MASALAYATQNSDGTHNLNFDGAGSHVYNPSTYSYLLTPSTGWNAAKGAVMSQFANYALTIGQQKATEIGYASLGLSLEQYGVNAMKQKVPGAVALTTQEQNSYACGDLTVPEVQAGQTQPTCGVLNTNSSSNPNQAASGGTSRTTTAAPKAGATSKSRATSATAGNGSSRAGIDPGVSLGTNPGLAVTGANPLPIALSGVCLCRDRLVCASAFAHQAAMRSRKAFRKPGDRRLLGVLTVAVATVLFTRVAGELGRYG